MVASVGGAVVSSVCPCLSVDALPADFSVSFLSAVATAISTIPTMNRMTPIPKIAIVIILSFDRPPETFISESGMTIFSELLENSMINQLRRYYELWPQDASKPFCALYDLSQVFPTSLIYTP